jgi:hypothetical protein
MSDSTMVTSHGRRKSPYIRSTSRSRARSTRPDSKGMKPRFVASLRSASQDRLDQGRSESDSLELAHQPQTARSAAMTAGGLTQSLTGPQPNRLASLDPLRPARNAEALDFLRSGSARASASLPFRTWATLARRRGGRAEGRPRAEGLAARELRPRPSTARGARSRGRRGRKRSAEPSRTYVPTTE